MTKTPQIHLIIKDQTAEINHAATVFFRDICGFSVSIDDKSSENPSVLELEYADTRSLDCIFIKQTFPYSSNPKLEVKDNGITFPFPTSHDSIIPFDPIALTWLLLFQRREQLNECDFDKHHRPQFDSLWITKNNLEKLPLIDIAASTFLKALKKTHPSFSIPIQKASFEATFDIDIAFAHRSKSIYTHGLGTASLIAKRDFRVLSERINVWFNKKPDPFNVFPEILDILDKHQLKARFFAMTSNRSKYDKNNSHQSRSYQNLLKQLAENHTVGLHPGYESATNPNLIRIEKERLENIINKPVTHIRQHFLRQYLPLSWNQFIELGFTDDYSTGFATNNGYRVGTCKPYQAFDIINQQALPLTLHPFAVMDTALLHYQQKTPAEVLAISEEIHSQTKAYQSVLSAVWHNYAMPAQSEELELFNKQISLFCND